jgi:hypothetical protein
MLYGRSAQGAPSMMRRVIYGRAVIYASLVAEIRSI